MMNTKSSIAGYLIDKINTEIDLFIRPEIFHIFR